LLPSDIVELVVNLPLSGYIVGFEPKRKPKKSGLASQTCRCLVPKSKSFGELIVWYRFGDFGKWSDIMDLFGE
jgi:hypothetical protein